MSTELPSEIPREFDGYRLDRQLGKGGMGEVWLCEDTLLERPVAIKFISARDPSDEARQRFLVEARAIARLSHPCVMTIHRVGHVVGRPYLVYEYVDGTSLDQLPLPVEWRRVLDIGHDLARGLATAHRSGVIHRDIKPANAILSKEGTVKLLDFGIARLLGPSPVHEPAESKPAPAAPLGQEPESLARTAKARPARPAVAEPAALALPEPQLQVAQPGPEAQTGQPFEQAARLTLPGSVLGTPLYMAPEIWRGEPATFASDVYSLGAVMYTLSVGRPPHGGRSFDELRESALSSDATPACQAQPSIDPQVGAIIDRCLRRSPAERYEGAAEVRTALAQVLRGLRGEVVPEGNPYRGLRAFEAAHRALFFGRESEMSAVLERMAADPLVLVAGDSGVGKSSLCRAGVLPRLGDWLDASRSWSVVTLCPGPHPLAALCAALAAHLSVADQVIADAIAEGASAFRRQLRSLSGPDRGLVLFIDQLEELVTLANPEEGAALAELLGGMATPTPGVKLLGSVRGDFLGRVSALPGLGDVFQRSLYFLRPLSKERLREVITGPAQKTGVTFESEALVDTLVDSTVGATGGLPLLQFALSRLYEVRDVDKKRIPVAALDALGGVAGALSLHADEVLSRLPPAHREAARALLLQLVTAESTRARRLCSELATGHPSAAAALGALVEGRLLAVVETPEGAACELAHEALLRGWGTLSRWLADDAGMQAVRERLSLARADWQRQGRPREALWQAPQLRQARDLNLATLPDADREFLRASSQAVHQAVWRRRGAATLVALALLGTWLGVHFQNQRVLTQRVDALVAAAQQHRRSAEAAKLRADSLQAQAFDHFDRRDKDKGEALWKEAQAARAEQAEAWSRDSQELEPAVKLDPERADVRGLFADSLYARALLADGRHDQPSRDELLRRLSLYDDGGVRQQGYRQPGRVSVAFAQPATSFALERYEDSADHTLQPRAVTVPARWPAEGLELVPGSYRLTATGPGHSQVRLPFTLRRSEKLQLHVDLPAAASVPSGFALVPPGRFFFGSAEEDSLRRGFLHAVPVHPVQTPAYLIALRETTFEEYLLFIESLPPDQRALRSPSVHVGGFEGALTLTAEPDGRWRLT